MKKRDERRLPAGVGYKSCSAASSDWDGVYPFPTCIYNSSPINRLPPPTLPLSCCHRNHQTCLANFTPPHSHHPRLIFCMHVQLPSQKTKSFQASKRVQRKGCKKCKLNAIPLLLPLSEAGSEWVGRIKVVAQLLLCPFFYLIFYPCCFLLHQG
ncbi:hypothetical protein AMECASPLE_029191 [Ameca splendens]|uniref:Uncharacterized protein n=1 Tax=Ameca splendens TaxID=208324 RepID=A0ABV0ZRP1_9TELE